MDQHAGSLGRRAVGGHAVRGRAVRSGRSSGRRGLAVLAAVGVAASLVGVPAAARADGATPSSVRIGSVDVPVLGQLRVQLRGTEANDGVLTVHGVRRVGQATVLYYSAGVPADQPRATLDQFTLSAGVVGSQNGAGRYLLDTPHGTGYSVLQADEPRTASNDYATWVEPGQALAMFVAFPALPAGVTQVDVSLGNNSVVPNVPVQDGPLLPAVTQESAKPVPLGTGWPAVDPAIGTGVDPAPSTFVIDSETETIDASVRTRKKARATDVDLSSDVLFAVDSAKLSPKSAKVIADIAATINAKAADGAKVTIVGHTDSTGSDQHNLVLSRQRAAAVEQALKPKVTVKVTFVTAGRGETEPIASNDDPAGRKLNRRVTVSFVEKES